MNGKKVTFKPRITFDQVDKKVLKELCGCNGSYCYLCFISKELASNPAIIRRGFDVEKNISDIIAKATELESQGKLNSKTKSAIREGITHMPLESGSLNSNHIIPPLHAKLNILTNVLELIYINNAKHIFTDNWPLCDKLAKKRTKDQKKQMEKIKKEFQSNAIQKPLNLKLGQHIIGSGGTSNTGGTADDFFSPEKREELLKIINTDSEQQKRKLGKFLCHVNVIIRVISTKAYIVNLEEFSEFCLEANAMMCELFPWKLCAASSHILFGHVCFAIARNGGYGLGQVHEGGFQKLLTCILNLELTLIFVLYNI